MRRPTFLLLTGLTLLSLGAATRALGQHPFEQREPQAPLERPVEVSASIGAGDQWAYHFGLNQTVSVQRQGDDQRKAGPLETSRLIQNATVVLRVRSIDEQTGTATVEATFERLLVIIGAGDEQTEFHWSSGSNSAEPDTDLERVLTALATSTLTARVSPAGEVRGVVGYEGVNDAINAVTDADSGVDRTALGLFAPSAFGSTLELIWRPGSISGTQRNITDAWTSVRRASLGSIGGVSVAQNLTVERIEDGILKARSEASLALLPPADPPGIGAPAIELLHDDGQMTIVWDLSRGCTTSASERLDLGALLSLGQVRLGVTMRSERSAALEGPPAGADEPDGG